MARPTKQGLDYFPLDVGFLRDSKIRRMMRANAQSIPVLVSLLCTIYRDDGFYMRWTEDQPFLVADELGISEGAVTEIAQKAIQVDFFDSDIFDKYRILTSRGIQKRYFSSTSRKKEVLVPREILLIDVSACNNVVFVDINSVSACNNPQSKVKESKEKQRKVKETQMPAPELPALSDAVLNECRKLCGGVGTAQYEELAELVELHGEARVLEALRTAGRRGHRRIAYAAGILKNWRKDGYDGTEERGGHSGRDPEKRDAGGSGIDKYRNITGL